MPEEKVVDIYELPPLHVQYCPKCGSKLIREQVQDGFNITTGKPIFVIKITCPNNGICRRHFFDIYDENGYSVLEYYNVEDGEI